MVGKYESRFVGNKTRCLLERYTVSYVYDDGEETGVHVINNLTYSEAKGIMRGLERRYPSFTKKAVMAKMVEVIV